MIKLYLKYQKYHYGGNRLLCNFIEIALWHGCSSPINLLHIFRTPFYKNTYGGLLPKIRLISQPLNAVTEILVLEQVVNEIIRIVFYISLVHCKILLRAET